MRKKKSSSPKCSAESGDSGSGSKGSVIVEDFYKARKPRKTKLAPALRSTRQGLKVAPCLRAEHHNTADVHFVACGPTTMINMPAKSIGKGLAQKSLSRGTSEKSEQARYLSMTSLRQGFRVKLFPLQENAEVFKTKQGELFSTKYAVLLEVKDLNTYSLRMLKDYFHTGEAVPSQLYSFRWMSLGMMSTGKCLTLNIGCPKTVSGSLSLVLEERVDKKYFLSKAMKDYIDKKEHHKVSLSTPDGELRSPIRHEGDKPIIRLGGLYDKEDGHHQAGSIYDPEGIAPILDTAQGGHREPLVPDRSRIRRVTPRECERLQGFPDDWTRVPAIGNNAGIKLGCYEAGEKDEIIRGRVMSDTQRYKMMGNAVSVPVVKALGEAILKEVKRDARK